MSEWGPAEDVHRAEFLTQICQRTLGYTPEEIMQARQNEGDVESGEGGDGGDGTHLNVSGIINSGVAGSSANIRAAASCQALHSLLNEGEFYQSKLSVAEKLAEKHTKDLVKQGYPIDMIGSTDRVSNFGILSNHFLIFIFLMCIIFRFPSFS